MSGTALSVQALSKVFRQRTGQLRHFFGDRSLPNVVALSNIDLEIERGECVGIIGHNGAGKTTLLRILARISDHTSGQFRVHGTMATLLEVGAGMHPELTGRDNIAFCASLLRINPARIKELEPTIIDFSGIGEAIDRPLRSYSSGMRLRLGFAIAAHVDADIIALDEALAVGDTAFQVRCLKRIMELRQSGRTILFVSHDLNAVKSLCARCIVLHQGQKVFDGETTQAIAHYRQLILPDSVADKLELTDSKSGIGIRVETAPTVEFGQEAVLKLHITNKRALVNQEIDLGVHINDAAGNKIHHFSNRFLGQDLRLMGQDLPLSISFQNLLKPGKYTVGFYLGMNDRELLWLPDALSFEVGQGAPHGFHNPMSIQAPVIAPFSISVGHGS